MAIEYSKVGWDVAPYKYANPDNMNKMDNGIKSACDGIDSLNALELDNRLKANGYGEVSGGNNIFNGLTESGYWDVADGTKKASANWQRTTNLLKVKADTKYYVNTESVQSGGNIGYFCCYNSSKTFIGYVATANQRYRGNGEYTTLANTEYISFYWSSQWVGELCISEYDSYEPYYESNLMLTEDANEIASLKYLGWTVPREMPIKNVSKTNGMTQRVGRVDLGSLSWTYDSTNNVFYSTNLPSSVPSASNVYAHGYRTNYVSISAMQNMDIRGENNRTNIYIKNTSYTDATAFRTALSGTYLYYQLSSPVEWTEGSEVGCRTYTKTLAIDGVQANTPNNSFIDCPAGVTSATHIPLVSFANPWATPAYTGRVFATITSSNQIRIGVYASETQTYVVNLVLIPIHNF